MTYTALIGVIIVAIILVAAMAISMAYRSGKHMGAVEQARRDLEAQANQPESVFGRGVRPDEASRALLDVLRSAIILTDGLGNVRYVSADAKRLDLVSDGHVSSSEIRDMLTQVVGDDQVRDREVTVTASAPSGRITEQTERYLQVRIGHLASIQGASVPDGDGIADKGGRNELYVIMIEDVSDRRHFESMRRDFVTNVSHELKTPAGAISLLAETISDAAGDPDAVKYFSGRISKESARLTELVQKLIELQKVQDDDVAAAQSNEPVCVPQIVREAVSENEVQASAKHIEIRMFFGDDTVGVVAGAEGSDDDGHDHSGATPGRQVDVNDEDAIVVRADAENLKTAVKNLVENAIHYSPEGTHVGVSVKRTNGSVQIRVVDQGIGIPAEAQNRIFERFYRVDPARSRATGGTGLGLSITKHIVQEAGGTISVWSRPNEGSTFTIELPRA
ncbi:sensor histidine kinase [Bifidobacterium simiarum]|uniref:sensor histidine kinase n=1 Tax=Bifidobacterium simiarum TaxID=2045441 RepID=UPI001BDD4D3B|nr:ATP-binding protein [Bifidobacterium simiarum]MBT1167106.1 two-component sensor histidine kinase [Bifidobacterium simiarum]